ncbi:MAG: hypothetical protein ACYCV5_12090, partial [Acidimicrobiales bacterium]
MPSTLAGRISYLKRRWGWNRTLFDGLGGATTWRGLGVLAHNAAKIAVLIDTKQAGQANPAGPVRDETATTRTEPAAPDPPPGPPPPLPPPDPRPAGLDAPQRPETAENRGRLKPTEDATSKTSRSVTRPGRRRRRDDD